MIMKRKTNLFIMTALFFLVGGMGCEKEKDAKDQLPPITQTGANTFGCLYNGKVFTPLKPDLQFMQPSPGNPLSVKAYYSDTENYSDMIYAMRGKNIINIQYIQLYLYQLDLNGEKTYKLEDAVFHSYFNQPFHCYISCRAVSPTTGKYKFYGSYTNSGEIIITRYDKENFVISGIFHAVLKEEDGDEITTISEGRFDLNLNTLYDKK
ncbi:MAG: hypothetical protein Q4G63_13000, partial [Bacteroidia bacterium]|nr:hypothetical protein [Bacteroidia bacterium]